MIRAAKEYLGGGSAIFALGNPASALFQTDRAPCSARWAAPADDIDYDGVKQI